MIYEFKCEKTNEVVEKDFPMNGEIPTIIKEEGKEYKRIYGQTILIPPQWGDIHKGNIKFDKSPSGKKHYW